MIIRIPEAIYVDNTINNGSGPWEAMPRPGMHQYIRSDVYREDRRISFRVGVVVGVLLGVASLVMFLRWCQ